MLSDWKSICRTPADAWYDGTMAEDTKPLKPLEDRIAERTAAAERNLEHMDGLARINGKLQLTAANAWDRTKTFLDNDNFNAWTGGALGAGRGFLLGALGIGALALTTAYTPVLALGVLAASTIGFAAYHAHKSYNESLVSNGEREGADTADRLVRNAGILPAVETTPKLSPQQALDNAKKSGPLALPQQTQSPTLEIPEANPGSHVEALRYRLQGEKNLGVQR